MSLQHKQIEGYQVEMDTTGRCYGATIPIGFVRFGKFSAPLRNFIVTGTLTHDKDGRSHEVPAWVCGRIEQWATDLGWPSTKTTLGAP